MKVDPISSKPLRNKHSGISRLKQLVILLLVALLSCTLTYYTLKKKHLSKESIYTWAVTLGHDVLRQDTSLGKALLQLPERLIRIMGNRESVPKLIIDIKFKNFQKIREKRTEALTKGFLVQGPDDYVPASIRHNGKKTKVKLRLKGDLPDHLLGDKWSFRIHVKKKDHIFGFRRFSIQNAGTRAFQAQPIFFEVLRKFEILAPRYRFVDVTLNGQDIGLMAVEEHFSKELLEAHGRRESVIIKFDESLFWDEWIALGMKGSIFNSYKNAPIDAFRSSRIAKSERLSRDYVVAVGLLRGFINKELPASEVFDAKLMGRFIAVAGLWGGTHSLYWNNQRYYYNPITSRLEPIGFDSFRKILSADSFSPFFLKDPIVESLLSDPDIFHAYLDTINDMSSLVKNGEFLDKIKKVERKYLNILQKEYVFLQEFPYYRVMTQVNRMQKILDHNLKSPKDLKTFSSAFKTVPQYPTILHAYTMKDSKGPYLEVSGAVPHDVEIQSIQWKSSDDNERISFEPIEGVKFPFCLEPTLQGALPGFQRINYIQPSDIRRYSLSLTANIKGDKRLYEIDAKAYYPAFLRNSIPTSSVEVQLSQHPFLEMDHEKKGLKVRAGKWKVNGSLVVPPGFCLTISGGVTLQFENDGRLVAHGPLYFNGTQEDPIILEGIFSDDREGTWQGGVVLNANDLSEWFYVTVSNTSGIQKSGWELTGGLTFYQSPINMTHCILRDNRCEDALNVFRSKFHLEDVHIIGAVSDGLDSDFSEGTIENCLFQNIGMIGGGDGLDVSGSRVSVNGTYFHKINDKALSVGEESNMTVTNVKIEKTGIGAACKDNSQLFISKSTFTEVIHSGLMAYTKKPEYGPAQIEAKDLTFAGNMNRARVQKGSVIRMEGIAVETEDIDADELYDTIMKPGMKK